MIMKGWVKIGITRTFITEFQLVASEANITISQFTMTQGIKEQLEENKNVDHTIPISTIMEECFAI